MGIMSEKIEQLSHSTKFWQFVRFVLNGGLSSAIHYGIYYLLLFCTTANVAYISALPWAFVPSAVGGSATQKIPDGLWTDTGWRILFVSGYWYLGSLCGVLAFRSDGASSYSGSAFGARLLFDP